MTIFLPKLPAEVHAKDTTDVQPAAVGVRRDQLQQHQQQHRQEQEPQKQQKINLRRSLSKVLSVFFLKIKAASGISCCAP